MNTVQIPEAIYTPESTPINHDFLYSPVHLPSLGSSGLLYVLPLFQIQVKLVIFQSV